MQVLGFAVDVFVNVRRYGEFLSRMVTKHLAAWQVTYGFPCVVFGSAPVPPYFVMRFAWLGVSVFACAVDAVIHDYVDDEFFRIVGRVVCGLCGWL